MEDEYLRKMTLYEQVDSLKFHEFASWEDHVEAILSNTIHQDPHEDYREEMHRKIDDTYMANFRFFMGVPDFGEIIQDIHDYNREVIYTAAQIQYKNDGYLSDIPLTEEEGIEQVYTMLWEFNEYDMFSRLEKYVYRYLLTRGFFFSIPSSYYTYDALIEENDAQIYVNDAQNIMFPDFLKDMREEISPYYYTDININIIAMGA